MVNCFIALGSNMGDRSANLKGAIESVGRLPETAVLRVSRFVETAPVGGPTNQGDFLNAAAELETGLGPRQLLDGLIDIELAMGRRRNQPWGPRPIDLDILLYDDARIDEPGLAVPHPRMHFRRFVLQPLVEIAPEARHPDGWTISERWEALNRLPHYLAITGPLGAGKTTLARSLAQRLGAELIEEQFDPETLGRLYAGDPGVGDAVQQYFLESRVRLLDASRWSEHAPRWLISDFWFAQSVAYADVLIRPDNRDKHIADVWREADRVLAPTLVIWLDAPVAELSSRIQTRGRDFEALVGEVFLGKLQAAFERLFRGPPVTPSYRPVATSLPDLCDELGVVAQAISGGV
jgi:2-amino-4-hydroxy-6-hydroxymethyldihydropteridine diphosphokinase